MAEHICCRMCKDFECLKTLQVEDCTLCRNAVQTLQRGWTATMMTTKTRENITVYRQLLEVNRLNLCYTARPPAVLKLSFVSSFERFREKTCT